MEVPAGRGGARGSSVSSPLILSLSKDPLILSLSKDPLILSLSKDPLILSLSKDPLILSLSKDALDAASARRALRQACPELAEGLRARGYHVVPPPTFCERTPGRANSELIAVRNLLRVAVRRGSGEHSRSPS